MILWEILLLIVGFAMLVKGADWFVEGAAGIASKFGIPQLVVGLTIVAMGTSAPEAAVSITAALKGNAGIAVGNVVGSNIFNIFAIVGCTAIVMPILVGKSTMSKEIPLVILSSLVLYFISNDIVFDGASHNLISRTDGFVLLGFFAIFMAYTFSIAKNVDTEEVQTVKMMPMWRAVLFIIVGLAGLIFGGQLFVNGASEIARSLGVSESVIGLTLVAAGTSLPELATSVVAAIKKNPGIAIGNVVGSCLFNLFFILGASAVITPLQMGGINNIDFMMLIIASVLLWFFGLVIGDRKITRIEGVMLLTCYVGYTIYLIMQV